MSTMLFVQHNEMKMTIFKSMQVVFGFSMWTGSVIIVIFRIFAAGVVTIDLWCENVLNVANLYVRNARDKFGCKLFSKYYHHQQFVIGLKLSLTWHMKCQKNIIIPAKRFVIVVGLWVCIIYTSITFKCPSVHLSICLFMVYVFLQ